MAKKKKSKVGGTKRKTRVGSTKGNDIMAYLLVTASGAGIRFAERMLPDIDKRILGGAKLAGGYFLPMAVKDAKTKVILQRIGDVMGSQGMEDVAKGFGILSGAREDGNDLYIAMNGDDISVLNGSEDILGAGNILAGNEDSGDDLSVVNGAEEDEIE